MAPQLAPDPETRAPCSRDIHGTRIGKAYSVLASLNARRYALLNYGRARAWARSDLRPLWSA